MADTYDSSCFSAETSPPLCHSEPLAAPQPAERASEESAFGVFRMPASSPIKSVDQLPSERCGGPTPCFRVGKSAREKWPQLEWLTNRDTTCRSLTGGCPLFKMKRLKTKLS